MFNIEKYKDEILEICRHPIKGDIALENGKPTACYLMGCEDCGFSSQDGENCIVNTMKWLMSESED